MFSFFLFTKAGSRGNAFKDGATQTLPAVLYEVVNHVNHVKMQVAI